MQSKQKARLLTPGETTRAKLVTIVAKETGFHWQDKEAIASVRRPSSAVYVRQSAE